MEYIAGPLLAVLISLGFTQVRTKKIEEEQQTLETRIEEVELEATKLNNTMLTVSGKMAEFDTDIARKVVGAVVPLSKSLKDLKEFTGMQ